MKEYIEREAALAICEQEYQERLKQADWCGDTVAWNIGGAIKGLPAADVAPVVRCRECRKWDADPDSYGKDDGPKGKCMKSFEETYDNDFCSYGERREADHDKHPSDPV